MKLILNGGGVGGSRQIRKAAADPRGRSSETDPVYSVRMAGSDISRLPGIHDRRAGRRGEGRHRYGENTERTDGQDFTDYACLYIGGGNTYKLLKDLKTSGAVEKIRKYLTEDGGIVYGGSAGAIIFGRDLDSCNTDDENEVGLADHRGFNLINGYSLLCHYTSRDWERTERSRRYLLELSETKPVYAIPEEDTIYVDNGRIVFIGDRPYYEFTGGTMICRKTGEISV